MSSVGLHACSTVIESNYMHSALTMEIMELVVVFTAVYLHDALLSVA